MILCTCIVSGSLFGQIATEIIRTSDSTKLVTVLQNGNVGIGVADPMSRLHVAGTVEATGFKLPTGAAYDYVLTSDATGSGTWQQTQLVGIGGSGTTGYLSRFMTSTTLGSSSMYQDGDGEIGIGTLTPDRPFVINGTGAAMAIRNLGANSNPSIFMQNDMRQWQVFVDGSNNNTDGFAIRDVIAGAERLIIDTDGDVAIGDFNPISKLHVGGTVRASAFTSSSPLLLQTNDVTRIYANDTTGNVGIGTTSPAKRLHVKGQGVVVNPVSVASPRTEPYFSIDADLYSTTMGILSVYDRRQQTILSPTPTVYIENANANTASENYLLQVVSAGSSRFVVRHDGKIGVGTTSPASLLHVSGTALPTGGLLQLQGSDTGVANLATVEFLNNAGTALGSIGDGSSGDNNIYLEAWNGTGGGVGIATGGSVRMNINSIGNVGIGTTSPVTKLDVSGTVRASAFSSSSPLLLQTNETTRIYVDDLTGNVGIGTTTPQQLLVLKGDETASGEQFQISTASGSHRWGIGVSTSGLRIRNEANLTNPIFVDDLASSNSLVIEQSYVSLLAGGAGSSIRFSTNATERMRIDHSGNVGLGTTTPAEKLDVVGTAQMAGFKLPTGATNNYVLTSDASGVGTWQEAPGANTSGTANYISKFVNTNTLGNSGIFEDGSGNIGIGTTTPQQKLVIRGDETMSGEQFQISTASGSHRWGIGVNSMSGGLTIRNETASTNPISIAGGAASNSLFIESNSMSLSVGGVGSNIRFSTNATERMRIDHSGNVGLGTTTPSEKLEVNGTVKATALNITGTTVFANPVGIATSPEGSSHLHVAGNVTINTANQLKLDGGPGTAMIRYNHIGSLTEFFCYPSGGFQFYQGGASLVRIKSDGNVGIGTTSPTEKLEVAGTVKASALNITGTTVFSNPVGIATSPEGSSHLHVAGNFTLNTANQLKLDGGAGTAMIRYNHIGSLTEFFCYPSGGFQFYQGGSSLMRIQSTGDVGIGTTSPSAKLDVIGTVRATAFSSSSPLLLQTNGTTRIFVNDTTGHVGIGTDSTTNLLTVKFNSATDPIADMWTTYSSKRWKTNVHTIDHALEDVLKLRGVSYEWKADGRQDIGFIAEEVGEIYPEIVAYEENGVDAKSVDYSRLVAVLVEALKEQQSIIDQQHNELQIVSARLEKIERLLNE